MSTWKALLGLAVTLLIAGVMEARSEPANPSQAPRAPAAAKSSTASAAPFDQAAAISALEKEIAGKENQPAEAIFMDIQLLKGVPAGRLLKIMELGYSRSLGVTCAHCHVPGQWQSDDKEEKRIARAMIRLNGTINDELEKIKDIKPEDALVNCTTCHRGQVKPALNLK